MTMQKIWLLLHKMSIMVQDGMLKSERMSALTRGARAFLEQTHREHLQSQLLLDGVKVQGDKLYYTACALT